MNIKQKLPAILKQLISITTFTLILAGCSGGSSASSDGGTVTGVSTPSKVSVVNTN